MASTAPPSLAPAGPYCQMPQLLGLRFAARDINLFARRPARSVQAGQVRTRFRGRGMDFEEVRLYQPGDDIRSIDWRVTARTQIPHTKVYSEERERPVYLVCDQRPGMFFGSVNCFKSVLAAHIAALLGWATLKGGDRLGALIFHQRGFEDIRARRSKHAVLQLLQALERNNHRLQSPLADNEFSLAQALRDTRRIARPGSAVFVISDFHDLDDDSERELFELARHLDITLMAVGDPLEQQLAGKTPLTVSNGRERYRLPVNHRDFQARFSRLAEARRERLQQAARRLRLEVMNFSTADDPNLLLLQRFGPGNTRRRQPR